MDLAFSTIFVRIPAAPPEGTGADGLRGETGRARKDFAGEAGRIGERGRVRELADRGERTWDGRILARDVVLAGGMGGPLTLFLGFSMSSFSLSIERSSLTVSATYLLFRSKEHTLIVSRSVVGMDLRVSFALLEADSCAES